MLIQKWQKQFSWWQFLKDNITIQILIIAIIAGIILSNIQAQAKNN